MSRPSFHSPFNDYRVRVMAAMAASLAITLGLVRWWPATSPGGPDGRIYSTTGQETIEMDEVIQTRQAFRAPPPPAPLPPVVVPNDVAVQDVDLDVSDSYLPVEEPGTDREVQEGDQEQAPTTLAHVETGPKPVRFVEPEYTRAARKKKIRAEVVIEVLVDERGRVKESRVLERYLLGDDEDDPKQAVGELGYGLEDAARAAAERWLFRPGRQNGRAVASYTTLTFSFGV